MNRSFGLSADSLMPSDNFPRAAHVDLDRYMRDWYVIVHIPPSITANAHDSVERYRRAAADRVAVEFTFAWADSKGHPKS